MRCAACGTAGEDIATRADAGPVWVHARAGACWEGDDGRHAFKTQGRSPSVTAVDRAFQRLVDGVWVWPWE